MFCSPIAGLAAPPVAALGLVEPRLKLTSSVAGYQDYWMHPATADGASAAAAAAASTTPSTSVNLVCEDISQCERSNAKDKPGCG